MATIHNWPVRPIVTLVSEFCSWDTQWGSPDTSTFQGNVDNVLKLQVACKYKKPYGGSAQYHVYIDKLIGNNWVNVIRDEFGYYPNPTDNTWHTELREYQLTQSGSMVADVILNFRITTQIEGAGHLPTGSGPGSLGNYSDPISHDFKATFKKYKIGILKEHFLFMEKNFNDVLIHYSTKKPT
jgi:hypothetical protein